ncbi:hypothetical protein [Jeotgalicoccus sp. WY2]|uniref:hypothetical protein n=1 Tax=Jeotgalicoccus sp. WY2 TaxID=2708346 RepID=UPI001BD223AE|nr:hypothetical protein [Jeotgalicoccus sp. WY2]
MNSQGKITEKNIYTTIGELGNVNKPIDDLSNKRIVCIPIGTGAMDIAISKFVYDKAKQGIGENFDFLG